MGGDDRRGRARGIRGEPACGSPDGAGTPGTHRASFILGSQKHIGNVPYARVGKSFVNEDRTEAVLAAGVFDLSNSESPEFIGRAVAALFQDPAALRRTGQVVVAAQLAIEYGFTDVDGKQPQPLSLADV